MATNRNRIADKIDVKAIEEYRAAETYPPPLFVNSNNGVSNLLF